MTQMPTKIDYHRILERYWELANLDPNVTKGSITGQLKALELLAEELRRAPANDAAKPAPPNIYRARWMDTKARPN